jgi:methylase of polypeptide subunit release factors
MSMDEVMESKGDLTPEDVSAPSHESDHSTRHVEELKGRCIFNFQADSGSPSSISDEPITTSDTAVEHNIPHLSSSPPASKQLKTIVSTPPYIKAPRDNEFRKEFSSDHPLAGGKGRYAKEKAKGLIPVGSNKDMFGAVHKRISTVTKEIIHEPVRQFLKYKSDLEDFFKDVLAEEQQAEDERHEAVLQVFEDAEERGMILRAIAEDRARASQRIKSIAEENEKKMKDALKYMLLDESEISY